MAAKPFIAARISEDLNFRLEDHARTTGESRTQIIINALSAYIGYSPSKETNESAKDRLTRLEEKVAELEKILKEPKQFSLLEAAPNLAATDLKITPDNNSDNEVKDETLSVSQDVINLDNTVDNEVDNTNDNSDNKPLIASEEGLKHPDPQYGEYLGKRKTQEIPKLPGLEKHDIKKIRAKLNNTKKLAGLKIARIGPYILFLTLLDKGEGRKQEFVWDVYRKTDNTLSS